MTNKRKSLVHKPQLIKNIEKNIAKLFSWHPNTFSAIKLFILTPLFGYILFHTHEFIHIKSILISLFLLFCLFDHLDGIIAREKGLETKFGRLFDRFTDYPLLLLISWYAIGEIPTYLVVTKVVVDLLLFV
jgi:phosphatidylglycerophosphate synthase